MKINVQNLAQIRKADNVEIKDFNVFIGKNGTGKTYFAKLIYFIYDLNYKTETFEKMFETKINNAHKKGEKNINFSLEEQKKFCNEVRLSIKKNYQKHLNLNKDMTKEFDFNFNANYSDTMKIPMPDEDYDGSRLVYVGVIFIENLFKNIYSHYLPAARANYMITFKYLFESQYNQIRDIFLNKTKSKKFSILPEIENNFLKDIYQVDTKQHGYLYSLGTKIEKKIIQSGKLSIKNPKNQDLPTYEFKSNCSSEMIDLTAVSSLVTEISPLIMYVRHHIHFENKELLIIDEPELSLHPDAQRALVEILVEAVNKGLKVLLVTHSPYILEALNTHLQRHKINNHHLPANIRKFEPIDPQKVSAYLFEDSSIKNILDPEVELVDDKLLHSFNSINKIYDQMRDIEWEANAQS